MFVNYAFLTLNSVVLPFLGENYLNEMLANVLSMFTSAQNSVIDSSTAYVQNGLVSCTGLFTLRLLMNATFVSAGFNLAQIPQMAYRLIAPLVAFTDKEKEEAQEAWPFAWGYWYAWCLANFTLCVFMCTILPSVLPLATLFYYLKYKVDKYNLDNRVYEIGAVKDETILVRVVFYMRFVVGFSWIGAGLAFTKVQDLRNLTSDEGFKADDRDVWVHYFAIIHIVLGGVLFVVAWVDKVRALHKWERSSEMAKSGAQKFVTLLARCLGLMSSPKDYHTAMAHKPSNGEVAWTATAVSATMLQRIATKPPKKRRECPNESASSGRAV